MSLSERIFTVKLSRLENALAIRMIERYLAFRDLLEVVMDSRTCRIDETCFWESSGWWEVERLGSRSQFPCDKPPPYRT
jgi:hypothetical protein